MCIIILMLIFLIALTQHHLRYLLEDTFDAHTKWRFIGLFLGLTQPILSAIKVNNPSSEEQYTEMLSRWIDIGTATVKRLIDALGANTVQMNAIANKLQEKYAKKATPQEGMTEIIVPVKQTIAYLEIHKS